MVYGLVTWRKNNALSQWKEKEKEKRWKKEKRLIAAGGALGADHQVAIGGFDVDGVPLNTG